MAFKSAFPEIPLKVLQVASSWIGTAFEYM